MALESVETQRCGLVFIYDMSDSKYANFDYDLSQKILTLLKVGSIFLPSFASFFFRLFGYPTVHYAIKISKA